MKTAPAYPVSMKYTNFQIELVDNPTLVWAGQCAHLVDDEGDIFNAPGLVFDTPWYHCKNCLDSGASTFKARQSVGSKFCPECGGELDWDHMERDEECEADVNVSVRASLDQVVAEKTANH